MKKVYCTNTYKEIARWGGCDDPVGLLEVGKEYTLEKEEMHSWHMKWILKEFPDKKFNSCHFAENLWTK